ncbi:unnamed protein product [Parajaminaea phylloscopi]
MSQSASSSRSPLAMAIEASDVASSSTTQATPGLAESSTSQLPTTSPALASLAELADSIAAQPERLGLGAADEDWQRDTLTSLHGIFQHALSSESSSLKHIGAFLRDTLGVESSTATRSGKKRKRQAQPTTAHHSLFPPTPLDQLVTDGMTEDTIWSQLDYRGQAIENVLSKILISTGALPEDDDDLGEDDLSNVPEDEASKRARKREADEDATEEVVNNLAQLSDAELRALGIDPRLRDDFLQGMDADAEETDDVDFEPGPDGDDDDEEGDAGEGYPGASDLSSDEEAADYEPGASKKVYFAPLRTEKQQRRKKEADERREMERVRRLSSMRSTFANDEDDEDDEESSSDEQGLEDSEEDADEEDVDEDESGPSAPTRTAKSLLDSLDDDGGDAGSRSGKRARGPRHPTLDDDFFSIDRFNRETEEQERREIFKEAENGDADDDEELDLFQTFDEPTMDAEEEDAHISSSTSAGALDPSEIRYSDFFEPPQGAATGSRSSAQKRAKGKGKGSRVGEGAKLAKQERDAQAALDREQSDVNAGSSEDESDLGEGLSEDDGEVSDSSSDADVPPAAGRVRFAPQVAIRNIKARRNRGLDGVDGEITPELLQALAEAENGDMSDQEDDDDDDEDEDDDSEDEDDDMLDGSKEGIELDGDDMSLSGSDSGEEHSGLKAGHESDADSEESGSRAGSMLLDEDQEQQTVESFAADLFGGDDDEDADEPQTNGNKVSAHERRLTQLQAEIKRLESENVGTKDWTLTGEASSRSRPKDSLLEQDLDFEQSARPTPTITVEKSEALEELIKRRILENRFDDVVPRRLFAQPEYRPEVELSDRKSKKSLAEEYEDEYRRANGDAAPEEFKSESERRLESDRTQITTLMDDLFDKLDALSNAHFTPRAPKATITTLSSAVPAISMEASTSALPATAHLESQLAPQETLSKKDIAAVMRGDASELTPEEKQSLRRQKKRDLASQKKQGEQRREDSGLNASAGSKIGGNIAGTSKGDKREKDEAMKKLLGMKGVTVVGKGDSAKGAGRQRGAGNAQNSDRANGQDKSGQRFKL